MCDYLFVSRGRRVLTVASDGQASGRKCEGDWPHARLALRRCLAPLALVCGPNHVECPADHRRTWVDVAGQRILLYESVAEDKSTSNAIATRLWRCSLGTASWLGQQAQFFDDGRVLEVGAGTGLCSLVLAATSTAFLTASDIDATAVALVRAAAHKQWLRLNAIQLDLMDFNSPLPPATWMIACDVMYTPEIAATLAQRCVEQLRRGGHVVVTDPDRKPRAVFQSTLDSLLGSHVPFIRLQEARALSELAREAAMEGKPSITLLLVDEHCRPPFF